MKNTALIMMTVILALMSIVPVASAHDSAIISEMINPAVNATDTNGNYNDTVNITLEVKGTNRTEISFPGSITMIFLSNLTFDAIIQSPGNIEGHCWSSEMPQSDNVWDFGVCDKQTNWGIGMHGGFDQVNEDVILKRLETRKERVEVVNLSFDPMCVMLDFPLWLGKNWTTTTKITGRLVAETGTVIPIDTVAVVSGAVTDAIENIISFEVAGELVSCLIRYNIEVSYPTGHVLKDHHNLPGRLLNISFDAIIPRPKNIEKDRERSRIPMSQHPVSHTEGVSFDSSIYCFDTGLTFLDEVAWELRDSTIYSYTKMTGMLNNVTKEPKMERLVIELEPGAEVANLSFDPMFELFYFPLYVGKNWTTTTNVTGILVNETGIESPIDSFAVVAGAVIEEVEVIDEMDQRPTFGLVIEVNISFEVDGEPVSCLIRYWVEEPPTIFPRDLCDAFAEREEDEGGHSI